MKKTMKLIGATLMLFAITLLPHLAVAYAQCPAKLDVLAVVAHHAASFATMWLVVMFAVLAARS